MDRKEDASHVHLLHVWPSQACVRLWWKMVSSAACFIIDSRQDWL